MKTDIVGTPKGIGKEALHIGNVMQRAFDMMIEGKSLKLSKKGKEQLNDSWENSSKQEWHIQAVLAEEAIQICSDYHLIYNNAPLDWFDWYGA
tara:strand:+ start:806 stop:1084 length:279 start_codon:yes stop_codon:yes gene_type:complete